VAVFNTKRVSLDDAPRTMHDLLDPRFKGRIVIARPQFGTTRGHFAALVALWGSDAAADFLHRLKQNDVRLLDGNAAVVRAVASGEADVGLTDTDDVWAGQRNGWPVALTYIRHDLERPDAPVRAGPLVIPNAVSRIKDGPNPKEAELLINYLLSEPVERSMALSESRNVPLNSALAAEFPDLAVPDPAVIDFAEVARCMDAAMAACEEVFGR
jgi:iron(III) transport system substrate-binding protein